MKKIIVLLLTLVLVCALTACNRADDQTNHTTGANNTQNSESAIAKASQSAVLQEARNKYTEAYAEDVSDGTVDGMKSGVPVSDPGYVVNDGKATYTYVGDGYTAVFGGAFWTVTEN